MTDRLKNKEALEWMELLGKRIEQAIEYTAEDMARASPLNNAEQISAISSVLTEMMVTSHVKIAYMGKVSDSDAKSYIYELQNRLKDMFNHALEILHPKTGIEAKPNNWSKEMN